MIARCLHTEIKMSRPNSPNLEEFELEADELVLLSTVEDLQKLAPKLGMAKESYDGQTRARLVKAIRNYLAQKMDVNLFGIVKAELKRPPPLEGEEEEEENFDVEEENFDEAEDYESRELIRARKEFEDMQKNFELMMQKQKELCKRVQESQGMRDTTSPAMKTNFDLSSALRRDFKISGQIGMPGQKEKLSFVSLIRQIENGLAKGYKESEIVEAIVKAISPGVQLRNYLETIPNLTLPKIRKIIRSHFMEKTSTELYQELATISQGPKEDPQTFLIRCLEIRQKILFSSKESGATIEYTPDMAQGLFLHALETGLKNESIRTRIRPLLKQKTVSDEVLIEEMSKAVAIETEHHKKVGLAKNTARISMVAETPKSHDAETPKNEKAEPQKGKMWAALEAVQADLATIREALAQKNAPTPSGPTNRANKGRGCASCQESGLGDQCEHCFICGDPNHFARGCRKQNRAKQGNGRRLPPRRDRE